MAKTANRDKLSMKGETGKKGGTGKFKVAGLLSGTKAQCVNRLENLMSPKQVGYGTKAWKTACDKLRNHIKTAF